MLIVWLMALIAAVSMALTFPFAGDAIVYKNTIQEVRVGLSPYASGIERLQLHHTQNKSTRTMNYIYPPITLPLIRAIGWMPAWLYIAAFWLLYAASTWFLIWIGEQCLQKSERTIFLWLSPLCIFFPGLLNDDYLLAGNVTPIFYGLIGAAAIWDWKRHQWQWFYLAVLLAALFKPPMLTLLAIPVLTATGEWIKVASTGFLGSALFLLQRWIWPESFSQYLQVMNLEGSYNQEFGFSPAGLLGKALLAHGYPVASCAIAYLLYAIVILLLLHSCSRHYLAGRLSTREWMPVLLIGVLLLNPRIKQYDAAAVTLPMTILAYRFLIDRARRKKQALVFAIALFAAGNILAAANAWDLTEMTMIVTLFSYAILDLRQKSACAQEVIGIVPELQTI